MNSQAVKPAVVRVKQGEPFRLDNQQVITCDEIARLAVAMHERDYFFHFRRHLTVRFHRDINGGGTQLLEISRKDDKFFSTSLIRVFFYPVIGDGDFLYEADLITDQRKDYEPTVNRGKHRFAAIEADLHIDWFGAEVQQWRADVERLSEMPNTLAGWVEADLQMFVICSGVLFCDTRIVLSKSKLAGYAAAGLTLEGLKSRLTCSKCGKRGARTLVF